MSLQTKDEYVKSIFLQMLSTAIQYHNETNESQITYLNRIVEGIGAEETVHDYMRKSLQLSIENFQEFIDIVKDKDLKYHFAINLLILSVMGDKSDENMEYLTDLLQAINVSVKELKYLSMVAKSIIMQDSGIFDDARALHTDEFRNLELSPYIRGFYAGCVIDNEIKREYCAPEKQIITALEQDDMTFTQRSVTFENIEIHVRGKWNFVGCEYIRFSNCTLIGEGGKLIINSIEEFHLGSSLIKGFQNSFVEINSVNLLEITSNEFINCSYTQSSPYSVGGVFRILSGNADTITIKNNVVQNCFVSSAYQNDKSGVFLANDHGLIQFLNLISNTFLGCKRLVLKYSNVYEDGAGAIIYSDNKIKSITDDGNNISKGSLSTIIKFNS